MSRRNGTVPTEFLSRLGAGTASIVGNWLFAVLVYLLPLFLPNVKFLTIIREDAAVVAQEVEEAKKKMREAKRQRKNKK